MASNQELVQLFNKGELGRLLARELNGERGRVYPNEDSDLVITFESEAVTPSNYIIAITIERHFRGLGYTVLGECDGNNCYQAQVSCVGVVMMGALT